MSDPDVDPAELEAQLSHIKEAMGLQERYEGITAQWLLFGVLVAVAAAVSQYVHLEGLPGYWHAVVWVGLLFGGGFVGMWYLLDGEEGPEFGAADGKPSLWLIFVAAYAVVFPIQAVVAPHLADLPDDTGSMLTLSLILVLVGLAYLLMGNALRAYYIRARDRWAFYVGGVLLTALAVAIQYVEVLQTWGYAAFGGLYLVYALATYAVLTRT
jgi:hypothetical protein